MLIMNLKKFVNSINGYIQWMFRPEDAVRVVVLGHQKSGTTAIGALLGRMSGFGMSNDPLFMIDQGTGKTAELLIQHPDLLKKYCKQRRDLFAHKIIKDPDFIFIYPALKEVYRNAKYVFVIRDPRDMIRSICNRLGLEGTSKKAFPAKADMKGGNHHWELILSGNLPFINGVVQVDSNLILNLAHRWNLATEIYMNSAKEMTLVKYEDFLKNKQTVIKDTARALGLPCDGSIAEYVDVQYQPKGERKVDWVEFFGAENLAGIECICSEYMSDFGYEKITR